MGHYPSFLYKQTMLHKHVRLWFGLVIALRPGQHFFSHVGTEPPLPR